MESYGEWGITVYDVIFGEIMFLHSRTLNQGDYTRRNVSGCRGDIAFFALTHA